MTVIAGNVFVFILDLYIKAHLCLPVSVYSLLRLSCSFRFSASSQTSIRHSTPEKSPQAGDTEKAKSTESTEAIDTSKHSQSTADKLSPFDISKVWREAGGNSNKKSPSAGDTEKAKSTESMDDIDTSKRSQSSADQSSPFDLSQAWREYLTK